MRANWSGVGPPVVLLHGQPGGSSDWQLVLPFLSDLRLFVPDRPGYDGTPGVGLASNADRLATVLASSGTGPVVIAGHSWGGGVALRLALDHPGLVAGLCLVGSVGSAAAISRTDGLLAARGIRHLAGALACGLPAVAPRMAGFASGSRLSRPQRHQLRATSSSRLRRGVAASFAVEQQALLREAPLLSAQLSAVSVPCVVLTGTKDRTVPRQASEDLANRLPRSELFTVPGGHLLPLERPRTVAAAIRRAVASADW